MRKPSPTLAPAFPNLPCLPVCLGSTVWQSPGTQLWLVFLCLAFLPCPPTTPSSHTLSNKARRISISSVRPACPRCSPSGPARTLPSTCLSALARSWAPWHSVCCLLLNDRVTHRVSSSARAAPTQHRRRGGFNERNVPHPCSEGQKSELKASSALVLPEALPLACTQPPSHLSSRGLFPVCRRSCHLLL